MTEQIADRLAAASSPPEEPLVTKVDLIKCGVQTGKASNARGPRCKNTVVFGTGRCVKHQRKVSRADMDARLQAMGMPAIQRLEVLAHQNENLLVSMAAVKEVLNRTMGHSKDTEKDRRPSVRIAIAVGGIPLPANATVVEMPAALPAPGDGDDD